MGFEPTTLRHLSWLCDHTVWFQSKTPISEGDMGICGVAVLMFF